MRVRCVGCFIHVRMSILWCRILLPLLRVGVIPWRISGYTYHGWSIILAAATAAGKFTSLWVVILVHIRTPFLFVEISYKTQDGMSSAKMTLDSHLDRPAAVAPDDIFAQHLWVVQLNRLDPINPGLKPVELPRFDAGELPWL